MATQVGRREFMVALGGAAASLYLSPLALRAQQATPVIGFLNSASAAPFQQFVDAFRRGLGETGFVEGKNLTVEYRWADGRFERLPSLAADLIEHGVALIVATGGPPAALAAKKAAGTKPVVFNIASDPIKLGLVESLNHPGGNATGTSMLAVAIEPRKLQFLHDLIPQAKVIGLLVNPNNANAPTISGDLQTAAKALGVEMPIVKATAEGEFGAAFEALIQHRAEGLVVAADPFFNAQRAALVALATQHALPAAYEFREFAVAGGLMSYGPDLADSYRQVGVYAGRILKGEKPADLPVVQPTRFQLVINRKTAAKFSLTVPATMLVVADEVIE